ncbi:MAG: efflux RND transporter permease subunit [Alphaproteobacteria bacterium]|nr:efflux RND transporter permease subunit [Alphaproteobacteria bacterium]
MLKFFIRRPVTTIMFVLFFVILGIVSFPKMNIERTPSVDFPYVTATFIYPGASSEEIETQVVKKAENAMSEVAGIKKITSQVYENSAFVISEFNLGVNVDDKANEVKAKIDGLANEFPDDLKKPVIEKLNPLQTSVLDIVISGGNPRDVEKYVSDTLSNKITAVKGVASVNTFGGLQRAVRIAMDPDLMAARGVTITDIVSAIATHNLNVPGGKIETSINSENVRFVGEFQNVKEIENLEITTVEGETFKLSDVANIHDAARDIEKGAIHNGENVVIMSVVKASDGNAIKISNALHKKIPELESDLRNHFADAKMEIVSDSSVHISEDTNDTINGIILGVIFTIIVLLAFTRNWRSTIIAGVVIPASLLSGFFLMNGSGFTINTMTLLAYATALGTLVSNAIILIESALTELRAGKTPDIAAEEGTRKVAVPVLAGVGTNVVVFLPLAFMGGIVGQFMLQFGMTVVYLTLLSLLFSFTLTPMMIAKLLRLPAHKQTKQDLKEIKIHNEQSRLRSWYDYQFKHPFIVILGALVVLIMSAQLMKFVGNEFSPSTDANEITITARTPMGSVYAKTEAIAKEIENRISKFPEVESTTIKIGDRGVQNINIKATLVDVEKRGISDKKLAQKMLPVLADISDAEIQIRAGENISGSGISSDIVLNIYGEDDAKRNAYANQIVDMVNKIDAVQSAVLAQQIPANEIRFVPNSEKMNFWGVKNAQAGSTLRTSLFGNDNYKYKEKGDEYPMILEFDKQFKKQSMFDSVYVNSHKGMVALSQLGNIENVPATSNIYRINKERVTEIDINIGKSTIGPVQAEIQKHLDAIKWENGYSASFAGMSEIQGESTAEIAQAFLLATILTFMLLAAIMNSFIHPFTIATSIITSFAGVFVVLFLSGASMNVGAMLAFIMLVGLVVNNNILVLEPTVVRVQKGEDAKIVLWQELMDKKRMIWMTTIAVVAGMIPQLWANDGLKVAMGAVMIGGMCASLIWTFSLTPALFFVMEKLRKKIYGQKH